MTDFLHLGLLAEGAYTILLAVALLYPLYAYSHNVMHREAVLALAATLVVFAVSVSFKQFLGLPALGEGIHALTDLLLVVSMWLFAREFVRTTADPPTVTDTSTDTGFEDAD